MPTGIAFLDRELPLLCYQVLSEVAVVESNANGLGKRRINPLCPGLHVPKPDSNISQGRKFLNPYERILQTDVLSERFLVPSNEVESTLMPPLNLDIPLLLALYTGPATSAVVLVQVEQRPLLDNITSTVLNKWIK
ncbi:hypothetical protein N7471_010666 [Penicillium samsonianum]|uniref:uncharacterized protein n=1 Tax=Penicillium samsonianum TaxID=1882272 RepID=UPI002546E973|nr:uncharacterized protein N7471_010666 [Penicillium samsonianum]KAJ6126173.1 hypothetical protein N7471_010666 [Penicillium samsonianum]